MQHYVGELPSRLSAPIIEFIIIFGHFLFIASFHYLCLFFAVSHIYIYIDFFLYIYIEIFFCLIYIYIYIYRFFFKYIYIYMHTEK